MSIEALQAEVESLQTKVAFQDDTIETLNQSIIDLHKELKVMNVNFKALLDKLENDPGQSADQNQVEIPPHY